MPTNPAPRPVRRPAPQAVTLTVPETIALPIPVHRYRVLFSDGALVDFLAYADHSGIRGQMLAQHYGKSAQQQDRIEGIAHLGLVYTHTPASP